MCKSLISGVCLEWFTRLSKLGKEDRDALHVTAKQASLAPTNEQSALLPGSQGKTCRHVYFWVGYRVGCSSGCQRSE